MHGDQENAQQVQRLDHKSEVHNAPMQTCSSHSLLYSVVCPPLVTDPPASKDDETSDDGEGDLDEDDDDDDADVTPATTTNNVTNDIDSSLGNSPEDELSRFSTFEVSSAKQTIRTRQWPKAALFALVHSPASGGEEAEEQQQQGPAGGGEHRGEKMKGQRQLCWAEGITTDGDSPKSAVAAGASEKDWMASVLEAAAAAAAAASAESSSPAVDASAAANCTIDERGKAPIKAFVPQQATETPGFTLKVTVKENEVMEEGEGEKAPLGGPRGASGANIVCLSSICGVKDEECVDYGFDEVASEQKLLQSLLLQTTLRNNVRIFLPSLLLFTLLSLHLRGHTCCTFSDPPPPATPAPPHPSPPSCTTPSHRRSARGYWARRRSS